MNDPGNYPLVSHTFMPGKFMEQILLGMRTSMCDGEYTSDE